MNTRSTVVMKLPEKVNSRRARSLLRQLKPALQFDQPTLILDLSQVCEIDTAGLDLLLHCLVEVANHDGSLKLAGISPEAATILEMTRMDRVFEMFPSVAEAVSNVSPEVTRFEPVETEIVHQPAAA